MRHDAGPVHVARPRHAAARRHPRSRLHGHAPDSDRGDSARARGRRPHRLRRNRHRQDRGLRRADAAVAARRRRGPTSTGPAAATRSRVLVLAPTRELAVQIEDEIHGLAYHTRVTSAAVYGGVEMGMQERALKAGVDIIVATPGRLMDHMRQQNADLSGVELLVLDEADRMMDMGFWPDVRRIIARDAGASARRCSSRRRCRTRSCGSRSRSCATPSTSRSGQRSAPAKSITHRVESVGADDKVDWLIDHLRSPKAPCSSSAHEDRRRSAGAQARRGGRQVHRAARRPQPGSAADRGRGFQGRQVQGAGRDRHRRARPRHRRASTPSSTTRCPTQPTRTCIAWAGPAARMRWVRRSRSSLRKNGGRWRCWKRPSGFV